MRFSLLNCINHSESIEFAWIVCLFLVLYPLSLRDGFVSISPLAIISFSFSLFLYLMRHFSASLHTKFSPSLSSDFSIPCSFSPPTFSDLRPPPFIIFKHFEIQLISSFMGYFSWKRDRSQLIFIKSASFSSPFTPELLLMCNLGLNFYTLNSHFMEEWSYLLNFQSYRLTSLLSSFSMHSFILS